MSNTSLRVIVSIITIPVIIAACYLGKLFFLLFILGIGIIGFLEFSNMVKQKNSFANVSTGIVAVTALIINSYYNFIEFNVLVFIIVLLVLFFELFRNKKSAVSNLGTTLIGVFYIGLFSSSLVLIREYFNYSEMLYLQGGYLIISIMVSIWVCDSAAFFLGTAFGKHKIFPRVSPKKSVEGALAGLVFAILTMVAAKSFLIDFLSWQDVVIIGLIIGLIGQTGDFVESLLKRDTGVKDSSSIIPGHGGVFDRFDSLLYSSPVVYIYIHYFI